MKKTFERITFLCIGLLCFGSLMNASAQTYEVTIFPPNSLFDDTTGTGLGGEQRVGYGRLAGMSVPNNSHALLWLGNNTTPIDLHPSSAWTYSAANDTDGIQQGGYVTYTIHPNTTIDGTHYAAVWNGSAGSFVQLCGATPATNCGYSEVLSVAGGEQAGFCIVSQFPGGGFAEPIDAPQGGSHFFAALWRGTAESFRTLHPRNTGGRSWSDSVVSDTDGVQQVGNGVDQSQETDFRYRGLLWNGTRDSYIDLTPPNNVYNYISVDGVKNNVQVGSGSLYSPGGNTCVNALVWYGTAESYRVLDTCASAHSTNGTTHVGSKSVNYNSHAYRWDDATSAGFDLHNLLPAGVYRNSIANRIDENGNIFGTAQRADNHRTVAVLWKALVAPNAAPQITMSGPGDSENVRLQQRIALSATAQDTDGLIASVEFYVNGQLVGTSTGASNGNDYSVSWIPKRTGTYSIQARATDNLGATTMCQSVTIRASGYF